MSADHLAFSIRRSALRRRVLIPKYYDPDIDAAAELARLQFDLVRLGDLLLPDDAGSRLGTWLRRELYGSGDVPYVRTSDLSHWRIRPDFKKAVAEHVYHDVKERQDVQSGDLLMVAHGTYLVGTVAIVTDSDLPLVLQDHVFRLRVAPDSGVRPELLLACLSTAFVRRQVRSKQFSADIIDKIGNRHLEILVPLPKLEDDRSCISQQIRELVAEQDRIRTDMKEAFGSTLRMSRERAASRHGFTVQRSQLANRILIPKYYDPILDSDLREAEKEEPGWVSIGELVETNVLKIGSGIEVGKMAYGTGNVPFVRTSDIVEGEIKLKTKHGISAALYEEHQDKAGVAAKDILVVRDGTYLVGSTALVSSDDLPALICGGIFRLRAQDGLDPLSLFGLLNLPVVKRQMRAKQFTRDVIDTLGRRFLEVRIPSPSAATALRVGLQVGRIMERKAAVKKSIASIIARLEPQVAAVAANRPGWSMR